MSVSYASITRAPVDVDLTKEALKDILPEPLHAADHDRDGAERSVARQFGVHVSDLRSDKRTRPDRLRATDRDVPLS